MNVLLVAFTVILTVGAYIVSRHLFLRYRHPLLNPVFLSTSLIIGILLLCNISFAEYTPGKNIMTALLGPATVALAVPLYKNRATLKNYLIPVLLGVSLGSLSTMAVVILVGRLSLLSTTIVISLAPKSITAPIAIEIASITGGDPALAAAFVVATGMLGSIIGPAFLTFIRICNPVARGLAMGTTAHGQGTAIALLEGETQGAMSGIAMALAAIFTSFIAPFYIPLFL